MDLGAYDHAELMRQSLSMGRSYQADVSGTSLVFVPGPSIDGYLTSGGLLVVEVGSGSLFLTKDSRINHYVFVAHSFTITGSRIAVALVDALRSISASAHTPENDYSLLPA